MSSPNQKDLRAKILEQIQGEPQGASTDLICKRLNCTPQELGEVFESLLEDEEAFGFAGLWLAPESFRQFSDRFLQVLSRFHEENPTVILWKPEDIAKQVGWVPPPKPLDRMAQKLAAEGSLYKGETGVRLAGFRPVLPERHRLFLDRIKVVIESTPINTPNPHQISQALHAPSVAVEEILKLAEDSGEVVQLAEGVYYTTSQLENLRVLLAEIATNGTLSASSVRDALNTTRKYSVALLTYFYPRKD